MRQLSNLDDFSVEEIAEKYPALNRKNKKRILKQCIKKDALSAESGRDGEERIVISGTECYNRRQWYKPAASVAALVIAVGGITGLFMLNRTPNGDDVIETEKTPAASSFNSNSGDRSGESTAATHNEPVPFSGDNSDSSSDNSNENGTPQTPSVTREPPVDDPADSVPTNTTPASAEQKSCLDGLYYVEISGVSGYLGFEFMPDGRLTKYAFDDSGNVINGTIAAADYEIVENRFSFGDLNSELNKKSGTIVNSNDAGSFSVQFDDGLYYFSTERPTFTTASHAATMPDTLNGLYYVEISGVSGYLGFEFMPDGRLTKYAFDDSGNVINGTIAAADYEIAGNQFSFGDLNSELNKKSGTIVNSNDAGNFSVQFDDGLYYFSGECPIFG